MTTSPEIRSGIVGGLCMTMYVLLWHAMTKPWLGQRRVHSWIRNRRILIPKEMDVVIHTCNLSTWKAKEGELPWVQCLNGLCSEFQASLNHSMRSCLKNESKKFYNEMQLKERKCYEITLPNEPGFGGNSGQWGRGGICSMSISESEE